MRTLSVGVSIGNLKKNLLLYYVIFNVGLTIK